MQKIREWDEIRVDYNKINAMPYKSPIKKLPEGHIFNEDMSVRWNRDKLAEHNKAVEIETRELREKRNKALEAIVDEAVGKIAYELSITYSRAELLWGYLRNITDSIDVLFDKLEDLVNLLYKMFRC